MLKFFVRLSTYNSYLQLITTHINLILGMYEFESLITKNF